MKQQSTTRRTSPQPAHGASDPAPAAFGPQQAQLAALSATLNSATPVQRASNRTGLPDPLKAGVEALSGLSMDHVRVHYNSARPAQLNAHAYAQGHEIHVATGQERHLPHEAWHVVQQAQGRVRATAQAKGDVALNDDQRLEREADTMGALAASGEAHSGLNRPGSAHAAVSLVSQLRRIAPALTAGATEVANGQSPSTDRVAPGPANVWDYTVTVTAPQADRAAALAAIRDEYRQMGHGFGNSFLAIASIGKLVTANAVVAGLVYDTLLPHGVLPVAAAPLTTNAAKKGVLVDNPAILTLPANLDFLLGLAGIATLVDPVRAVIRASYGNPAHTISSTVEYSEGLKGYISKVQDTGPQVSASLQDRPNYAGEYPIPGHHMYRGSSIPVQDVVNGAITAGFGLVPRLVTFSNVHHTGGRKTWARKSRASTRAPSLACTTKRASMPSPR